ncbi:MAG: hypothetical protein QOK05_718 [Chloroflexota bacterium]|nr:hypothetical protein [Chloroflexota bacterium]
MDPQSLQRWLNADVEAWKSYDPGQIGALFAEDAEYRYHPYDSDPDHGRAAIVASWTADANRDRPGTYDAVYTPFAIDGSKAVATGTSRYYTDESRTTLEREYHNVFLMSFDGDGRCSKFNEYYMRGPEVRGRSHPG